jgi:hypothetical protein
MKKNIHLALFFLASISFSAYGSKNVQKNITLVDINGNTFTAVRADVVSSLSENYAKKGLHYDSLEPTGEGTTIINRPRVTLRGDEYNIKSNYKTGAAGAHGICLHFDFSEGVGKSYRSSWPQTAAKINDSGLIEGTDGTGLNGLIVDFVICK